MAPGERELRIKNAVDAADRFEDFDFLRDQTAALPVVRLPLELPVYRMENFRTYSEQAEYIAVEQPEADFFRAGQERESAQQVQHNILARLAARGKANSVAPILDVLEREGQRERLLITRSGVVVNGNRRLAAMRELFAKGPEDFPHFSHVNCLVLPADITPSDVLDIEAVLQARPETRLDYDWIGDAQLLSAMLRIRGTPELVAKRLGRKAAEVRNTLSALSEADLYLKEWAKSPGEYRKVAEDGEQLFKDLPGLLAGKPPALQEASRVVAWTLFDNRRKLDGRVYNYNVVIGKRVEDVLDRFADQLGLPTSDGGNDEAESGEEFSVDIPETTSSPYSAVVEVLTGRDGAGEGVEALIDICTNIVQSEREQRSGNSALKAVTTANTKLAEVDVSRADPATYDAIERQLATVLTLATQLRDRLSAIRQASNTRTE